MRASSARLSRARWGQHFLVNVSTVEKILDALGAGEGETVVEVGPGRGALTRPLLDRGARVLAFEIDPVLAARLSHELAERALFVETADVLRADVEATLARIGARPPVPFVGNLPYESATPMLRAFVRRPDLFSRLVVMIQKEVADRIVALPGGDAYGFLTLDVGAHAAARRLFDVEKAGRSSPPKPLLAQSPNPCSQYRCYFDATAGRSIQGWPSCRSPSGRAAPCTGIGGAHETFAVGASGHDLRYPHRRHLLQLMA